MLVVKMGQSKDDDEDENEVVVDLLDIDDGKDEERKLGGMRMMMKSLFSSLSLLLLMPLVQLHLSMKMNHFHSNSVVVGASIYAICFLHLNRLIHHHDEENDYLHSSHAYSLLLNDPSLVYRNDQYPHLRNHQYDHYHRLHSMGHHRQNSVLHNLLHLQYNEGISSFA